MEYEYKWLSDLPPSAEHAFPVISARSELFGYTEADVRRLRAVLQWVFEQWRDAHGAIPVPERRVPQGLLTDRPRGLMPSGNDDGNKLTDWHPYACAGPDVFNYVSLLYRLVRKRYEPLVELSTLVPWNEALAAMILSEAFDYPSGGVGFAYELLRASHEAEIRWQLRIQRTIAERLAVYAERVKPFTGGGAHKKGRVYEPKRSIRTVCEHIGSTDFTTVVEFFRDADGSAADQLADLFWSTITEMNLYNVEIDDRAGTDKGRLSYVLRGNAATAANTKSITLKRLKNILTEIRTGPPRP